MGNAIRRYLEDAIAAEKSFETQLRGFAGEAAYSNAKKTFLTHANETRQQYDRLTARLQALGGEPSLLKSALAHFFNIGPKIAQIGHSAEERSAQDLIIAYSVENAETAMYESLAIAAESAGDSETADLARHIQAQEMETAQKLWALIGPVAADSWSRVNSVDTKKGSGILLSYIEDAEAAERNFEDALAGFSRIGEQPELHSLFAMMSAKARTQHERLEARLRALGGTRSAGKSILAHMLAFSPLSAQAGHGPAEKSTQVLMITCAAAAAEMAMYEALASTAQAAGDERTALLARELQWEEKEDHRMAWKHLGSSARHAAALAMHGA